MNKKPVLELINISFSYNASAIVKDVNLSIMRGDFVAMIGPNGGGKTTLLKLMLGLLSPDTGNVSIFGKNPINVLNRIGYVPQNPFVNNEFPLSALDVVLMGRLESKIRRFKHSLEDKKLALNMLLKLDMGEYANRRIGELSGGQLQRVYIARALATNPDILMLDEPMSNIDSKGRSELNKLLKELNKSITIILVSHDLMILSSSVKSVACVNQRLHYHKKAEITDEMTNLYQCPVELIAQGLPMKMNDAQV